jgi:hypothetical protein
VAALGRSCGFAKAVTLHGRERDAPQQFYTKLVNDLAI